MSNNTKYYVERRIRLATSYSLAVIKISRETPKTVTVESYEVLIGNKYLGLDGGVRLSKDGCVFDTLPEAARALAPLIKETMDQLEGRLSELRSNLLKLGEIAPCEEGRRE